MIRFSRESLSDSHFAAGEGPQAVDGVTRAGVAGGLSFKQRRRPLGTVGGPHRQHSPVVLAERQGAWLPFRSHVALAIVLASRAASVPTPNISDDLRVRRKCTPQK